MRGLSIGRSFFFFRWIALWLWVEWRCRDLRLICAVLRMVMSEGRDDWQLGGREESRNDLENLCGGFATGGL